MVAPFFAPSTVVQARQPLTMIPKCGACGLWRTCKTPKMKPSGKGRKKVLIVAEAPGREEDEQGRQLVGVSGQLLEEVLYECNFSMRGDATLTNALICRPPNNVIKDKRKIDYCRPNLLKTVRELEPEVIILLGAKAVKSLIGHLWKEDTGGIGKWAGMRIPVQALNAWVCPTFHPAFVMRERKNPMYREFMKRHLAAAVSLKGRPYTTVPPDPKKKVRVIHSATEAAKAVQELIDRSPDLPLAFDFETNMLKPDSDKAAIACCSISDGGVSIAFHWIGRVIEVMKRFITSFRPKIGYNLKFEDRWCRRILNTPIRGEWVGDGMLTAHGIDSRKGITGLKFQAFSLLGIEAYNDVVRPYLESKDPGGNSENRVFECDRRDLLTYCGIDSLLEVMVYHEQKRRLTRA